MNINNENKHWSRMILLVDMNAFFASVEQLDHPEWQAKPIAITNGSLGSTIITCSYEARAYGVKTGMRLKEARLNCPTLIQAPTRPRRYADLSIKIMDALAENVSPDIEVFSIDEAFLDATGCQRLLGTPEEIGKIAKIAVKEASGLLCSVGISGDKTTAKYAAKLNKPDGLTIIPPWDAEMVLAPVPVEELCGIAKGIGRYLNNRGVYVCGDMKRLPVSELTRRFGNPGKRIWLMAQGKDPLQLIETIVGPKSIGHGKVIPPKTTDLDTILMYYQHMAEKVAYRLRQYDLRSNHFMIGLRMEEGFMKVDAKTAIATNDGKLIYELCVDFLARHYKNNGAFQVQITALNPCDGAGQLDLFSIDSSKRTNINQTMDSINQRYGQYTLSPARLLNKSTMPDVIAPAWKPDGIRQTIGK